MPDQSNAVDRIAYREAGHAAMSYLIRKGYTEKYVPADRSCILPEFESVSISGARVDWGQLTFSLASLITVSQVLLAGEISERLKFGLRSGDAASDSAPLKQAGHLIYAYVEEFSGKNIDHSERDDRAAWLVQELTQYVEEILCAHWASVEALVTALMEGRRLSESEVFEIVEREIPEPAKSRAEAFAARDPGKALKDLLDKTLDE